MAMTREQQLLVILSEECAEVQQLVSKILRFGLYSYHPEDKDKRTNQELLHGEIVHVLAMVKMLEYERTIKHSIRLKLGDFHDYELTKKMSNVEKNLKVSESLGLMEAQWPE